MKKSGLVAAVFFFAVTSAACLFPDRGETPAQAPPGEEIAKCRILTEDGGHLAWGKKNKKILFDRRGDDGWFDLWVMNADGTGQKCLTSKHPVLPNRHIGQPAWHPSEKLIALQAQKADIPRLYDNSCCPGAGALNDLWIITPDGKQSWKLHSIRFEISKDSPGVLHPHFSHDGTRLFWAERIKDNGRAFGEWILRIAEFSFDEESGPRLGRIRDYNPGGGSSFFESHSFSPDDKYVLFTGNQDRSLEIYEMEVATGNVKQLTEDSFRVWNEHANYSPDGKKIVWMSSKGLRFRPWPFSLKAEFWIMDRDGSSKRQVTWFNTPDHPHYLGKEFAVAADPDWSSDGRQIVGLVVTNKPDSEKRDCGLIIMIDLPED